MKVSPFVAIGLAAAVAAASAVAADVYSIAGSGISGSRHDINAFAAKGGVANVVGDTQERVCAFCHSPHHAYTTDMSGAETADYLPLWAHELTSKTYTGYASDSLNAVIGDPLVGPSRLCMSCHDGVIAVDTHYQNLGANKTGAELIGDDFAGVANPAQSGAVGLTTSLAGDHPIGFDYINAKEADLAYGGGFAQGIKDEATSKYLTVGVAASNITIKDTLWGVAGGDKRIMTCATCHEVHNKDNVVQKFADGSDMDVNYFLYGSQSGSKICLSCHNK